MAESIIKPPRKAFDVIIRDKAYSVYNIEGREHPGYNDTIKTWWLYWADQLPEGTIPPADSEDFIPWDSSINRLCWELKFKDTNTHKIKWDEHRFSNGTTCEMYCNGRLIYSFRCGNMDFALAKARYLQTMLLENPGYDFINPEKNNGRKIWWYNLPATIRNTFHPGEIAIIPDYTTMSKEEWWKAYKERSFRPNKDFPEWDRYEEGMSDDYINWGDALSDGHIGWFRD